MSDRNSRTRFARREVVRLMEAVERIDAAQLDSAMRVLHLEEQLADARLDLEDMRAERDTLRRLMAAGNGG